MRRRCLDPTRRHPFSAAQEVAGAVAALDPELGAALATKGGDAAIKRALANVPLSSFPHADVLVALASGSSRSRATARSGARRRPGCRAACARRTSRRSCLVGSLDEGDGPKQAGVYTKLMVNTRIDALVNESLKRSAWVGDAMIQLTNDYEMQVFSGDVGRVTRGWLGGQGASFRGFVRSPSSGMTFASRSRSCASPRPPRPSRIRTETHRHRAAGRIQRKWRYVRFARWLKLKVSVRSSARHQPHRPEALLKVH